MNRIERIAKAVHVISSSLKIAEGNPQPYWESLDNDAKNALVVAVEANITQLHLTPEQTHEKFLKEKGEDGWTYGENYDEEAKTSPALFPYSEVPVEVRKGEYLTREIVRTLAPLIL